jgi:hypothetical protein
MAEASRPPVAVKAQPYRAVVERHHFPAGNFGGCHSVRAKARHAAPPAHVIARRAPKHAPLIVPGYHLEGQIVIKISRGRLGGRGFAGCALRGLAALTALAGVGGLDLAAHDGLTRAALGLLHRLMRYFSPSMSSGPE